MIGVLPRPSIASPSLTASWIGSRTRIRPKTLPNRSGQTVAAACTRRVSAARLAPSGEVVTRFQSDSARTDSRVRVLPPQPRSPVLKVSHFSTAAVAAISSSMAVVLSQPGCRPRRKPGVASPFYRAEADTDVSEAPSDEGGGIESASAAT
jgi:hypothetical protein